MSMRKTTLLTCLICIAFAGSAASQPRCTADGQGAFRCVGANGQTNILPLDDYRASGVANPAGAGIAPTGALKAAPSGPAPASSAAPAASVSIGSVVIIPAGKHGSEATTITTPKTCSWDSTRGVKCE